MKRWQVLVALLGLVAAATAVRADVPQEVTILGQKYALEAHPVGGQYKNGLTVVQTDLDYKGGDIRFVPGETPEQDRLFIAHAFPANDDTQQGHQFYVLQGTDASGIFNQATSNMTEFFGGNQDFQRGGRIANITWISNVDTGKKMDRNIALNTFTDDDTLRFYDLDTLTGDFRGDAVHNIIQRCINFDEGDPGMPNCGFVVGAPGPNGTLIFMGRGEGDGPQIGVLDPTKDSFFDVLTNLGSATADQDTPIDILLDPHDFEQIADNEYLLLAREPGGLADAERFRQVLYRLRITLPENLATAEPESVQVQVTGEEVLLNIDEDIDLLGAYPGGIVGLAVGRRPADNAPPRLYLMTADGQLVTANPVAP